VVEQRTGCFDPGLGNDDDAAVDFRVGKKGPDRVDEHRRSGQHMKLLGMMKAHPGAAARGGNNGGGCRVHDWRLMMNRMMEKLTGYAPLMLLLSVVVVKKNGAGCKPNSVPGEGP